MNTNAFVDLLVQLLSSFHVFVRVPNAYFSTLEAIIEAFGELFVLVAIGDKAGVELDCTFSVYQ